MLVSNIAPNAIVETTMANMEPYKYVTAKWIVVVQSMKIVAEVMQMVSTTLNMNTQLFRSVKMAMCQQGRVRVVWGVTLHHVRREITAFTE